MLCEAHCREPRIKYTTKPKPVDDSHSFYVLKWNSN